MEIAEVLSAAPREIAVLPAGSAAGACGARSYVADGRVVCWTPQQVPPGARLAVDAEIATQPVREAHARRFGPADPALFWPAWTRVEVSAKLADVPVLVWLQEHGLEPDPGGPTLTFALEDLVVSVGIVNA